MSLPTTYVARIIPLLGLIAILSVGCASKNNDSAISEQGDDPSGEQAMMDTSEFALSEDGDHDTAVEVREEIATTKPVNVTKTKTVQQQAKAQKVKKKTEAKEEKLVIQFTAEEQKAIQQQKEKERRELEAYEKQVFGKVLTDAEREEVKIHGKLLTDEDKKKMAEDAKAEEARLAEEAAAQAEEDKKKAEAAAAKAQKEAAEKEAKRQEILRDPSRRLEWLKEKGILEE
jgi:hypothetical protein